MLFVVLFVGLIESEVAIAAGINSCGADSVEV